MIGSIICRNIEAVKYFIEKGVNPDSKDMESGYSTLHFCVEEEQVEILKYLITKNANVDSTDNFGNTPLFKAIFKRNSSPELINILIKNGTDIDRENNSGNSPKELAKKFKIDLTLYPK